ncbi:MAG: 3-dehydroquinate dehydratase [Bacteroidetes bacterium]|nr:3-dehydroquinate dehydratase [Bacteroidota bacterium]
MKIAIINGPNLNLLGIRETKIYGTESFEDFFEKLIKKFPMTSITYFQNNVEGVLINELQKKAMECDAIIFNPGGYTHTSVALGDTVAAIQCPVLEVHLSNINGREDFRKISHISAQCKGTISGMGLKGYELAVYYIIHMMS